MMLKTLIIISTFLALFIVLFIGPTAIAENMPETQIEPGAEAQANAEPEAKPPTVESNAETIATRQVALDTGWTLFAAVLVMFMQAGFAMLTAGFSRSKNACNMLMKNLMDFCFGSIFYWAIGFGLMFGAGNLLFGKSGFFLIDSGQTFASLNWTQVPLEGKYFFQLVFCATAATIVAGALAERTRFIAYIFYSIVITAIIYPIVGHWIWGGGWLAEIGMWDFAGSTVVHSTGGWVALIGAIMLGPRTGKYNPDGSSNAIPGHSIPLATLGTFILWFGWFGFNPGSTMALVPEIAHIATTTNLAGAAGGISAMVAAWWMFKKVDVSMALNGVLVVLGVVFIDQVLHIDDPVGAITVHGVCGFWGTLALGLFAQDKFSPGTTGDGLFFGGSWKLLGAQALGTISVFAWCMTAGFILFYVIKHLVGLRVSREEELRGLDLDEHGMEAYSGFQIFTIQ